MKKYLGYIPAVIFTVFYLLTGLTGAISAIPMVLIWLGCFYIAAVLLHKGIIWGGVFGTLPALHMIYRGDSEILIGIAIILFYLILGIYLWKKRDDDAPAPTNKAIFVVLAKIALTVAVLVISAYTAVIGGMILMSEGVHQVFAWYGCPTVPAVAADLAEKEKEVSYYLADSRSHLLCFSGCPLRTGEV